ncbi:DMT family transporter [Dyadobacter sp. CY312]|uniref:DMT family transporter n=1 Tax=Dyadobacter sp. CY312 TaxID=2907303 RepID=UPI001F24E050|nr:DMT family transporter [Dyadobacter sp. CY312]MCE7039919.1 DMT family transporter [Dyadobacter sp. CY312]
MKNNIIKGSILVALGASSYGMLATFVKMAYSEGFSTAEVTLSQFMLGFAGLFILTLFRKKEANTEKKPSDLRSVLKLVLAGTSMGLTSIFYYMAVQYIPVSVGIVLLMQTVWMGVILEMILHRKAPGLRKTIAVFIILAGTALATNLLTESVTINWIGFGWGMMAALSYTASMYASNNIVLHFPSLKRSLYLILGGLIIIAVIFYSSINSSFSYQIFLRWGLILSLFGTILPPLLFTRGVPLIGMGLGAIIASVEIPVSILMAHLLLGEPVSLLQWTGVALILFAVVLMNIKGRKKGLVGSELATRVRDLEGVKTDY